MLEEISVEIYSTSIMKDSEFLKLLKETNAILSGHFILSSGLRSSIYLQCAKLLMHPQKTELACRALAKKIKETKNFDADMVLSPAIGGVIVGFEVAKQLALPSIFVERNASNQFELRRDFEIKERAKVVVVEDVITTGSSAHECVKIVNLHGASVKCVVSLVDRSTKKIDFGCPFLSLLKLDMKTYSLDNLPDSLKNIPAVKPGSNKDTQLQ